jgi:hypothetical protein
MAASSTRPADAPVEANGGETIVIPLMTGPAKLGTDLAAAPWDRAARITGLLDVGSRRVAAKPTWVYLCYDQRSIWVAYRCEGLGGLTSTSPAEAGSGRPSWWSATQATDRDGRVWRDECVEFYCSADISDGDYYQVSINAAGTVYDGQAGEGEWNGEFESAVAVDRDGFTVAMRVPFKQLKARIPRPGAAWSANFARHGPLSGSSGWCWSYNGLNSLQQFGRLVFGGPNMQAVKLRSLAAPSIGENIIGVDGLASGMKCEVVGQDCNGVVIDRQTAGTSGNALSFRLDDDRVRVVETTIVGSSGKELARWSAEMGTPQLTPRLADWTARLAIMKRTAERFPTTSRAQAVADVKAAGDLLAQAQSLGVDRTHRSRETWQRLGRVLDELDKKYGDLSCYARTLDQLPDASFAIGFESPMRKVLIREHPFEGRFDRQVSVSLAGNEHEAFQAVVIPYGRDLKDVRVDARMDSAASSRKQAEIVCKVSLVGHVDVNDDPPYEKTYQWLWPDPLLSFLQTAETVKVGEHVAFWVDVATGKNTPAGEYSGKITVAADGCKAVEVPLKVRVWDFKLPDGTHLKNAFTYHEAMIRSFYRKAWTEELGEKYRDLVLDHRLGLDHLYRHDTPDLGLLKYAASKGMNAFNIIGVGAGGNMERVREAIKTFVPRIRREGLLNLAYFYGFDEVKKEKFESARESFEEIHRTAPGIPTMTTAQDHSFGRKSGLREAVDIWVPLTPSYDYAEAEQLRREGKQMWWYICLVPIHPYANWFIEYPAIESRLLMGAMSYKYKVDGFLYYLINNGWERNKQPISSGPVTNWDPASCPNSKDKWANGDGNLIYPGPNEPLSSIRLENIRDGLEDYEYLYLLAERVKRIEKLPATPARKEFLAAARPLLAVPDTLVRNLVEFTTDAVALDGWRTRMAELIVAGEAADRPPAR